MNESNFVSVIISARSRPKSRHFNVNSLTSLSLRNSHIGNPAASLCWLFCDLTCLAELDILPSTRDVEFCIQIESDWPQTNLGHFKISFSTFWLAFILLGVVLWVKRDLITLQIYRQIIKKHKKGDNSSKNQFFEKLKKFFLDNYMRNIIYQ